MAAMTPATAYWIANNGSLSLLSTATVPTAVYDASPYRAVKIVATVGSPGLTTAATGIIIVQPSINPEIPIPAAGIPTYNSADGSNAITGINAVAFNSTFSKGLNVENSGIATSLIWVQFALGLQFATVPTAGADMFIYVLGCGWKSYE